MPKKNGLADIKQEIEKWELANAAELEADRKKNIRCADSDIPIKAVYTPLDLEEKNFDYVKDVGMPGAFPFTRGITPTMYRNKVWNFSQVSGHATPEESNELWKGMIAGGGNRIALQLDLPSQMGLDPDHPMAEGEVGRVGVSFSSLRDWEIGFSGIDVGKIQIYTIANALAPVEIASHIALAEQQGVPLENLMGCCQNDILKEFSVRGNFIFPPAPSMRLLIDTICYCSEHFPKYDPISVSECHFVHRGATLVHSSALGLADFFTYFQHVVDRGVDVDIVAPHVTMIAGCEHVNFFQEIARHRAMRRIFAKVMKDRFKAKKPESMRLRVHGGNGGISLHKEQYLNNIARDALATLAAALSGFTSVDLRAYDEQFGIPTQEAILTSIHAQQVVAYETGIGDTVDPLAGSYYIEWLTSEFEERINKELEAIDQRGGVIRCIEEGYIQRLLAEDGYKWYKALESGEMVRVGFNRFQSSEESKPLKIYRADLKTEGQRVEAVRQLRKKRDQRKVQKALEDVTALAREESKPENNMMVPIIEAVKAYCTVGEIADALKKAWGEFSESRVF
ncbi:MAG: methylmalonyl-CoA mutase family protein [Dehalococcoidales bacterium]|nr:methylmalonyl-CoA mutase family protein [Dehalococcoidales bacterium]